MTHYVPQNHAYIDEDKTIKIVNDSGTDYKEKIKTIETQIKNTNKFSCFMAMTTSALCLATLGEQYLSDNLAHVVNWGAIGTVAVTVVSFLFAMAHKSDLNGWKNEFNLAKVKLGPRLLELDKQLEVHLLEIQEEHLKNKLAFMKKNPDEQSTAKIKLG